jgi:hypothetical protein
MPEATRTNGYKPDELIQIAGAPYGSDKAITQRTKGTRHA